MDFLLDVNASGAVARWLIDRGHNVVEVGQTDPTMRDDEILSWAVREHRIIVTTDNDFEEMIWRQGKAHYGILRLENLPRLERQQLLIDVLKEHSYDSGRKVSQSQKKFRRRKMKIAP